MNRAPRSPLTHRPTPRPVGRLVVALVGLALAAPGSLRAQEGVPTRVVVRAIAQDAKIIGSGVGGARIMIRDAVTGQILASGVQEGGTGDTGAIMGDRTRDAQVFATPGGAAFEATLALAGPTLVVVEAEGPLGAEHALQRASTTLLLVPGHDVVGDGVILTLHGFTVEVLEAPTSAPAGGSVTVQARVTMLCGCPTEPGGMWDADRYDLMLHLVQGERVVATGSVTFAGETSRYTGALTVPADVAAGDYALRVVAVDAARANAGMVLHPMRIER